MKNYTIMIRRNELEAIVLSASMDETRYNINSILVEMLPDKTVILVSTDGHRLTAMRSENTHALPLKKTLLAHIPREDLVRCLKVIRKDVLHVKLSCKDGHYSLADIPFIPGEGEFLDWRKVVPEHSYKIEMGYYNPFYINDAIKAIALYHGKTHTAKRPFSDYTYFPHGFEEAVLRGYSSDMFVVIMPMRPDTAYPNSGREWVLPGAKSK